jgi:hypothetical protein
VGNLAFSVPPLAILRQIRDKQSLVSPTVCIVRKVKMGSVTGSAPLALAFHLLGGALVHFDDRRPNFHLLIEQRLPFAT